MTPAASVTWNLARTRTTRHRLVCRGLARSPYGPISPRSTKPAACRSRVRFARSALIGRAARHLSDSSPMGSRCGSAKGTTRRSSCAGMPGAPSSSPCSASGARTAASRVRAHGRSTLTFTRYAAPAALSTAPGPARTPGRDSGAKPRKPSHAANAFSPRSPASAGFTSAITPPSPASVRCAAGSARDAGSGYRSLRGRAWRQRQRQRFCVAPADAELTPPGRARRPAREPLRSVHRSRCA